MLLGGARCVLMGAGGGGAPPVVVEQDGTYTYRLGAATADPITFNHTAGGSADCVLVEIVAENGANSVSNVKWGGSGGQTLTKVTGGSVVSGALQAEAWVGVGIATGTQQVWVDLTASAANFTVRAGTYTGVNQTTPVLASTTGTVTGGPTATGGAALNPGSGQCWLSCYGSDSNGSTASHTFGGGSIVVDSQTDEGAYQAVFGHQDSVTSSVTPTFTRASGVNDLAFGALLLQPS